MGLAAIAIILIAAAIALYVMGRVPICKCGYVKFWHGVVQSSENSQHLLDWYTLSHIVHGFLFYFAAWAIAKWQRWRLSFVWALVAAVSIETAWEIFENTEFVINRYREATISLDYFGDSIVNSLTDIIAMIAGFLLGRIVPVGVSILAVFGLEIFAAYIIRDNLLLNIVMLVYPLEFIKAWQGGG